MTAPSANQWFKSSYSGGSGTECVECAHVRGEILVRDSKLLSGRVVAIKRHAWQPFVEALGRGVPERG